MQGHRNVFYFCKFVTKHLIFKFKRKYYFTDFEICLLSGVAIFLWPFVPTGSIFNNWLNMTILIQISFYLFIFNKDKLMYEDRK